MKLYYAPGACSIGIHVLLEEIGKPYDAERVNLQQGEQYKPPFTTVNPKSKVPTLTRDDGSVLTEFPAIAYWLAKTNLSANLLPDDVEGQAKALELTDYAVATIHMQGFGRQFRPSNFTPAAADEEAVKARGQGDRRKGLWAGGQGARGEGLRSRQVLDCGCRDLLRGVLVEARRTAPADELRGAS